MNRQENVFPKKNLRNGIRRSTEGDQGKPGKSDSSSVEEEPVFEKGKKEAEAVLYLCEMESMAGKRYPLCE